MFSMCREKKKNVFRGDRMIVAAALCLFLKTTMYFQLNVWRSCAFTYIFTHTHHNFSICCTETPCTFAWSLLAHRTKCRRLAKKYNHIPEYQLAMLHSARCLAFWNNEKKNTIGGLTYRRWTPHTTIVGPISFSNRPRQFVPAQWILQYLLVELQTVRMMVVVNFVTCSTHERRRVHPPNTAGENDGTQLYIVGVRRARVRDGVLAGEPQLPGDVGGSVWRLCERSSGIYNRHMKYNTRNGLHFVF